MLWTLAATLKTHSSIVEVGSWCGRSTIVLAHAATITDSRVLAIDVFPRAHEWHRNEDSTYSVHRDSSEGHRDYTSEVSLFEDVFDIDVVPVVSRFGDVEAAFIHFVDHFQVQANVQHFVGTVAEAKTSGVLPHQIHMAFIDGDHGEAGVRSDIATVLPRMAPGSWFAFDDAFSVYPGVDAGISWLRSSHGTHTGSVLHPSRKLAVIEVQSTMSDVGP